MQAQAPKCQKCGANLIYVTDFAAPGCGQAWRCSDQSCARPHVKIGSTVIDLSEHEDPTEYEYDMADVM
jgi:predicted RNA-binding Zn-ribbon protein involved in translation (DUF1610 family)